jgi:hypothetical protein
MAGAPKITILLADCQRLRWLCLGGVSDAIAASDRNMSITAAQLSVIQGQSSKVFSEQQFLIGCGPTLGKSGHGLDTFQ